MLRDHRWLEELHKNRQEWWWPWWWWGGVVGRKGSGRWPNFSGDVEIREVLRFNHNGSNITVRPGLVLIPHRSHQALVVTLSGAWRFSVSLGNEVRGKWSQLGESLDPG